MIGEIAGDEFTIADETGGPKQNELALMAAEAQ
jgi:hypothetical protein